MKLEGFHKLVSLYEEIKENLSLFLKLYYALIQNNIKPNEIVNLVKNSNELANLKTAIQIKRIHYNNSRCSISFKSNFHNMNEIFLAIVFLLNLTQPIHIIITDMDLIMICNYLERSCLILYLSHLE